MAPPWFRALYVALAVARMRFAVWRFNRAARRGRRTVIVLPAAGGQVFAMISEPDRATELHLAASDARRMLARRAELEACGTLTVTQYASTYRASASSVEVRGWAIAPLMRGLERWCA